MKIVKILFISAIAILLFGIIGGIVETKYFEFQCLRGKVSYCKVALNVAVAKSDLQTANKILETKCVKSGGLGCVEYAHALYLQNKEINQDIFSKLDKECAAGDNLSCNNFVNALYLKSGFLTSDFKPDLFLSNEFKSIKQSKQACDKNYGSMCFVTALKYQYAMLGKTVSMDKRAELARSYARKGCDRGYGDACFAMLNYLPQKITVQDGDLLKNGCKNDSTKACAMLGAVYERGSTDYTIAVTKACANFNFMACSELGNYFISTDSPADAFFLKSISCNFGYGCEELTKLNQLFPKQSFGKESAIKNIFKTKCENGEVALCFMHLMTQASTKSTLERGRIMSAVKGITYLPISYSLKTQKEESQDAYLDKRPKDFVGCGRIDGPANVRSIPNGSVLKQILHNKYVRVFEKKDKWLKIDLTEWKDNSICMYENVVVPKKFGWIHEKNIQPACSLNCD